MSLIIFKIGGVLCALIALLFAIRKVGPRLGWPPEWQRKTLHIALGATALTFPRLFDQAWQVFVLCGLGFLVLLGLRLVPALRQSLGRCLHDVKRTSHGELFFALSIVGLFWLTHGEPLLYALPMAILTFADAAAALVGNPRGAHRFAVMSDTKSWEGVAAFSAVAFGVAMLFLLWVTSLPWPAILLLAITVAVFSALVEAMAWHGLDNLLIPLGVYLCLTVLFSQEVDYLFGQLLLLGGLAGLAATQPWGRSPHTLMIGVLTLYCLLIGGNLLWLVGLLLVLLTHFVLTKLWEEWESNGMAAVPGSFWLVLAPVG